MNPLGSPPSSYNPEWLIHQNNLQNPIPFNPENQVPPPYNPELDQLPLLVSVYDEPPGYAAEEYTFPPRHSGEEPRIQYSDSNEAEPVDEENEDSEESVEVQPRYTNPYTECCDPKCKWTAHQQKRGAFAFLTGLGSFYGKKLLSQIYSSAPSESSSNTSLFEISNPILIKEIFFKLPMRDIISVSLTCKKFNKITQSDSLWMPLFQICFSKNLKSKTHINYLAQMQNCFQEPTHKAASILGNSIKSFFGGENFFSALGNVLSEGGKAVITHKKITSELKKNNYLDNSPLELNALLNNGNKNNRVENNNNNNNEEEIIIEKNNNRVVLTPQQETLNEVKELIYSFRYGFQSVEQRAQQVNALLENLPQETQNQIHGKIYILSSDPHKGGDQWGKRHIADDDDVLLQALNEVLFN